jgi:hypothetical protein
MISKYHLLCLGFLVGLGWYAQTKEIPAISMPPHTEILTVPGLSLDVNAQVHDGKLRLTYSLKNLRQEVIFPFSVLWASSPNGDVIPAPIPFYVTLPQPGLLHLSQQIPPLPLGKRVEQRVIPFATKLAPGQNLSKSYDIDLPLQEYNPYFPPNGSTREDLVATTDLIFTMQIVADQAGIQTRPAQLADALFLTHPALMAHVETLRSQSIPVRVTVKKRLDQFGEF